MTTDTKLLPCPFCGAPAHGYAIEPHSHSPSLMRLIPELPDHPGSYVIEGQCACGSGLIGADETEVVARWNRRAPQPSPAAQGDALSDDAVRVPLDKLHADAAYLIGRLREGSMPYARVIEIIRERIDAAKAAIRARAAQGDALDAARYRWLREGNDAKHGAAWHVAVNLYGCEWDAAIDAALAAQGGK